MEMKTSVAIVGAGPYGLAIAAHLRDRRVAYRIFGKPMDMWHSNCPRGMFLKSDGFACDLYDPTRLFTLKRFCAENQRPYHDTELPVSVETFVDYGVAFQKALIPDLTERLVNRVSAFRDGYRLEIDGGETVTARAVVMATGVTHCSIIPEELKLLPPERCTHSSGHQDLTQFAGKRVLVVGGGASATDIAAILNGLGSPVEILSRKPIEFHTKSKPQRRTLWERIIKPNFGLGANFKTSMYVAFPNLFHLLPQRLRLRITRRHLPPAAGYFVRHHVEGKVPMHIGYTIRDARVTERGVAVHCTDEGGSNLELQVDHVIAATGYRPSVDRLTMLDETLRASIEREDGAPRLSRHFESSVPGLYFVGLQSANSFGPVMRFVRGSQWAALHMSRHLASGRAGERVRSVLAPAAT
jgi:cation diffusion facilitator CzcD-associated flavoprotein CzcO